MGLDESEVPNSAWSCIQVHEMDRFKTSYITPGPNHTQLFFSWTCKPSLSFIVIGIMHPLFIWASCQAAGDVQNDALVWSTAGLVSGQSKSKAERQTVSYVCVNKRCICMQYIYIYTVYSIYVYNRKCSRSLSVWWRVPPSQLPVNLSKKNLAP